MSLTHTLGGSQNMTVTQLAVLMKDERGSVKSTPLDEKGRNLIPTPSGGQDMTIINESGFSKVILRSEMKMKRASIR